MSLSTPRYLALLEKLSRAGVPSRLADHSVVARGFADIGAEEYVLLPGAKLVSLVSGAASQLPEEHRQFFFDVRSIDELIEIVLERGGKIESIAFPDQRLWQVAVCSATKKSFQAQSAVLEEALANAILDMVTAKSEA